MRPISRSASASNGLDDGGASRPSMMMLRTSPQSAGGEARRSGSCAIQIMSPCSPAAIHSRRRWPSSGTAAGAGMPKAEKPRFLARAASAERSVAALLTALFPRASCTRRSEIEIGVMLRRRDAGNSVGEQRTKARPGFQARIPCARRFILVPWHVSKKVHARKLRGGGETRIRHARAREPIPLGKQPADIFEMIAQIGSRRPYGYHVGRAPALRARHEALEDLFGHEEGRHFG